MRIPVSNRTAGSTLLLTMIMTGIMGFSLASYLILVRAQNLSIMRSASWNSCIPLTEAGIEEAMTHLNRSGISNLLSAGWTASPDGYTRTRYLGNSYYTVTISATDPPMVMSEGHVPAPLNAGPALGWLAAVGLDLSSDQFTGRRVRVSTRRESVWTHAMVAKSTIDLNGNNITTDSFDSTDPNASTDGQYDPDQAARQRRYRHQPRDH